MTADEHDSPGTPAPRHVLDRIWDAVEQRRGADPSTSYVASLLARHPARAAQKIAEEAAEAVIEAVAGRRDAVVTESADLLFHLLVLLAGAGIPRDAVYRELVRRMKASSPGGDGRPKRARRRAGTTKIP